MEIDTLSGDVVFNRLDDEAVELPEEPELSPLERSGYFRPDSRLLVLDHDHDGHPGGSLPRARLTDLQVAAYTRDVMDAYMGQHEVKRADGWNRVWTMRHEIVRNHDMMLVRCARGPMVAERLIPASQMSNERAEEAVRAVDGETER